MKTSIYVCYHNKCNMLEDGIFKYIYCGAAINGEENYIPGTLRDDSGDNISHKNRTLCELTAMYWAWKNDVDSDYIGFMHYRRHLNFSDNQSFQENEYGVIYREYIDGEYESSFSLNSRCINNLLSKYDIILPKSYDVTNLGAKSNYDQYAKSENHHIKDYSLACDLLKNEYPELENYIFNFNSSKTCYFTNIFVMRRDLFIKYMHFLFHIVFKLEGIIDFTMYNPQEARAIAYMSERFFNIYINHMFERDNLNVIELQRTYVNNTAIIKDVEFCDGIPIVFSFNNSYVKYAYQAIRSLVSTADKSYKYCIFILHLDINTDNIDILINDFCCDNFKINFINCNYFLKNFKPEIGQSHISRETYLRLLIPNIFKKFEKVIYLDSDVVVKRDISKLFSIDISDKLVAGVHDYMMSGFVKNGAFLPRVFGYITAEAYLDKLGLNHFDYIQAGVLVFNVKLIIEHALETKPLDLINNKFWFNDQDIINIVYKENKLFLDIRWNVAHGNGDEDAFFKMLPINMATDYFNARKDPFIIHFAGDKKPWHFPSISYAKEFWNIARLSPYYEEILLHKATIPISRCIQAYTRYIFHKFVDELLPKGSRRRLICKIVRNKFFGFLSSRWIII